LAHNPVLDRTGADCAVDQSGPVWFLPRIAGPRVFSGTRSGAIPADKAILLEIGAYVDPYPSPDPAFHPAPGQSLYDFLIADAGAFMDRVNWLEVSLDVQAFGDVLSSGDLSLQPTFATADRVEPGEPTSIGQPEVRGRQRSPRPPTLRQLT
jgi:hypothetical protein